jgi:predicted amidohydrolase
MKSKPFKLALIQMKVEGGQIEQNLLRAGAKIAEAAYENAQVVMLPEAMDLGWTHPSALTKAQPVPDGETCQFLINEAKKNNLYICAGLIEQDTDKIYNSAVIINPDGVILLKHRKINELDIGRKYYSVGDDLNVCQTEFGTFGMLICADAKDHLLLQRLGEKNASVILSPCSWAVPADHDNNRIPYGQEWVDAYRPPAKEFSMWIAGCSNVGWMSDGPWQGYKGIGCSLIVDPKGEVAATGPYGVEAEAIIYMEIADKKLYHR